MSSLMMERVSNENLILPGWLLIRPKYMPGWLTIKRSGWPLLHALTINYNTRDVPSGLPSAVLCGRSAPRATRMVNEHA